MEMKPVDFSVKLDLKPQLDMSSEEINARKHLDQMTQIKNKADEIMRQE